MGTSTKAEIRARMRSLRSSVIARDRRASATAAAQRALELPQVRDARYVLGFAPASEEFDVAPLLDALAKCGATIALPRIVGPDELTLHLADGSGELESGPFGIRQPAADAPQADAGRIDLVIVPGIAFDPQGSRIGFGAGYYDRLLPQLASAYRLALAYDFQVVESLPVEPHDIGVQAIVTPEHTLVVGR
ncbi:MAG: 5-formyltetrahydrofolate cyclo-ligase [Coriobacteriia bacterium]